MARIPAEDMIERARAWVAPGERDALWAERGSVVDRILGGEHVYAQELSWQRPYRFGAYRADLVQAVLETRVLPLWGVATNAVETALGPDDHAALTAALPTSNDAAELKRAVRVCAELYESALTRWAERTGRPRPENPLAPAIRRYLDDL